MTDQENGEIRRRLKPENCSGANLYGCFIDGKKDILSSFCVPVGMLGTDTAEAVLKAVKKVLSGTRDKNLLDIAFDTAFVMESDSHKRLMTIKDKRGDEAKAAVDALFADIAENYRTDGCYMALILCDRYDIPDIGSDGIESGESANVFPHFILAICPVKETKQQLTFSNASAVFGLIGADTCIGAAEAGFLFPAFDNRGANIYNMQYYTKSGSDIHPELICDVIGVKPPIPADSQKEMFDSVLNDALSDDCSLDVALTIRDTLCEKIAEHKESREPERAVISQKTVGNILRSAGVKEEKIEAFKEKYDETFGEHTNLAPQNLVNTRSLDVSMPDVTIKINTDRSDLIGTRVIDGIPYLVIRAESDIEVNGIPVNIKK